MTISIENHWLADDGLVPNNPSLPLMLYRGGLREEMLSSRAEASVISRFDRHDWSNAWINGIYPFHHYHATVHEVLAVVAGWAVVQFGGPKGPNVRVDRGDAVLIPAGVGHCRMECSSDLSVVGAYPGGADWDLVRPTPETYRASLPRIAGAQLPNFDPVTGHPFLAASRATSAG